MPDKDYTWLQRDALLSFEELKRIAGAFVQLGTNKIRITGGEPLLRRDLPDLIRMLNAISGVEDIAMTTNGVLLADQCHDLQRAGLKRVTISLDTLQPQRYESLTGRARQLDALRGIEAARAAEFSSIKLNTVVMRDFNDDELCDLLRFAKSVGAELRFIEYMDVGGASQWSVDSVVSQTEILQRLEGEFGSIAPAASDPRAPAGRFVLPDGTHFGIIASTTAPFCDSCDRSRLTADGMWFTCLYAQTGFDLRTPLREGTPPRQLAQLIAERWRQRADRGAKNRLNLPQRGPLLPLLQHGADPHIQMHTRGG